jgi:hypothetical protein
MISCTQSIIYPNNTHQGAYVALAWAYLDFLTGTGFFMHQWNVRFRNLEAVMLVGLIIQALSIEICLLGSRT